MPLMTPAAVTGIHAICTAQIATPATPNSIEIHHQHQADAFPRERV